MVYFKWNPKKCSSKIDLLEEDFQADQERGYGWETVTGNRFFRKDQKLYFEVEILRGKAI